MKPSQYFSHMIQKVNEAELLQTPDHDIMTSFLATNCPDPQQCLELLGSDYVSLNGMVNRALTYEQAQSVFKKPTEEVNAVQAKKRSQYQEGKRNKNQPASTQSQNKVKVNLPKRNVPAVTLRNTSEETAHTKRKFAVFARLKVTLKFLAERKKQKEKDDAANYMKEECQNAQI